MHKIQNIGTNRHSKMSGTVLFKKLLLPKLRCFKLLKFCTMAI